jgi:hypothetical protein
MNKALKRLTVGVCGLLVAASVSAAPIVQTLPYSFAANTNQVLGFAKFDDTGGDILTSVQLELLSPTLSVDYVMDNEHTASNTVDYYLAGSSQANAPSSLHLGDLGLGDPIIAHRDPGVGAYQTTLTADNDGAPDFVGADSFNAGTLTDTNAGPHSATIAAGFAPYLLSGGAGNVNVTVATGLAAATVATTAQGNVAELKSNFLQTGSARLTYTWVPIPEPNSLALFGLVGVLGLVRRRRR